MQQQKHHQDFADVHSFGRRKVLMTGGVGQSLCFFLLGALSKVAADKKSASFGAAAGSFIFIYDFVFAATWLSVPWVYVSAALSKGSPCHGRVLIFAAYRNLPVGGSCQRQRLRYCW